MFITNEALKALNDDLQAAESREGDYLAALDSAAETVAGWVAESEGGPTDEEYPPAYHWLGWEAEEDFEPGRPDTYFLTICYPDGEEMAVIVHRTVDGKFPLDGEGAKQKEQRAQAIVDALNAANGL